MLLDMSRYLVEVHVVFNRSVTEESDEVEQRLRAHDATLDEPAPRVLSDGTEQHTIVQFAIEETNQVKADARGRDVATEVLGATGEGSAEISLVSARDLAVDGTA